jgi:hypothetical protein
MCPKGALQVDESKLDLCGFARSGMGKRVMRRRRGGLEAAGGRDELAAPVTGRWKEEGKRDVER